jgi:hypothetical protein
VLCKDADFRDGFAALDATATCATSGFRACGEWFVKVELSLNALATPTRVCTAGVAQVMAWAMRYHEPADGGTLDNSCHC